MQPILRAGHTRTQPLRDLVQEFELWTAHDNHGSPEQTSHRTWFYFSINGHAQGDFVIMAITNFNKLGALFANDYRTHFRAHPSMASFKPMPSRAQYSKVESASGSASLRISHKFESAEETFFAFCAPWSCEDNEHFLQHLDNAFATEASLAASSVLAASLSAAQAAGCLPGETVHLGRNVVCSTRYAHLLPPADPGIQLARPASGRCHHHRSSWHTEQSVRASNCRCAFTLAVTE